MKTAMLPAKLILSIIFIVIINCAFGQDSALIGTWRQNKISVADCLIKEQNINFECEMEYICTFKFTRTEMQSIVGTYQYSIEDSFITVMEEEGPKTSQYKIIGKTLTFTSEEGPGPGCKVVTWFTKIGN